MERVRQRNLLIKRRKQVKFLWRKYYQRPGQLNEKSNKTEIFALDKKKRKEYFNKNWKAGDNVAETEI